MHLLQDQSSWKIFQSAYIFFIPFEAAIILGKTKPVFLLSHGAAICLVIPGILWGPYQMINYPESVIKLPVLGVR